MPKYITTRTMTYNTRRLKAGDELVGVSERDGNLLVRLGKASIIPDSLAPSNFKVPPPPVVPPKTPESKASGDEPSPSTLDTVRAEYERVVGKRWFHGWDEAELRKRIDEHQSGAADDS